MFFAPVYGVQKAAGQRAEQHRFWFFFFFFFVKSGGVLCTVCIDGKTSYGEVGT